MDGQMETMGFIYVLTSPGWLCDGGHKVQHGYALLNDMHMSPGLEESGTGDDGCDICEDPISWPWKGLAAPPSQ